ncbi:unnamed protein product, partial [Ectocarpus fasciculatus]
KIASQPVQQRRRRHRPRRHRQGLSATWLSPPVHLYPKERSPQDQPLLFCRPDPPRRGPVHQPGLPGAPPDQHTPVRAYLLSSASLPFLPSPPSLCSRSGRRPARHLGRLLQLPERFLYELPPRPLCRCWWLRQNQNHRWFRCCCLHAAAEPDPRQLFGHALLRSSSPPPLPPPPPPPSAHQPSRSATPSRRRTETTPAAAQTRYVSSCASPRR